VSPRKKTELVTIDTADELDGQLDGWRQMAVNTLRAGGLLALNVDAISSSASIRRIMFRGGRFKDRESGETHTLTTEEIAAIQLIEEVQVLRDRLVEQRHGAPITLQEGILGGIRLMMLREAIVTPRWLAAPSRAAGKLGGRPTSAATRLIAEMVKQFPAFKKAQSVLPNRERAPKKWRGFSIELDAAGRYLITHEIDGKARATLASLRAGFSRKRSTPGR
jgi:hypothetical protein